MAVIATDGVIGEVRDIYFDDESWRIRYYVVDTGKWLPGRKVLLPPDIVRPREKGEAGFPVELTREQVRSSPDIDKDRPISRQAEATLYNYYGWTPYWIPLAPAATFAVQSDAAERERSAEAGHYGGDPHLRSAWEVRNYRVLARDGEIGHVEDFLYEDQTGRMKWVVVDTRNWLPGKQVLISPDWITEVKWAESRVVVRVDREAVRNSPAFDPAVDVDDVYESGLYTHYGYPPVP
jgi:uncharacterized protein YrrD